MAKQFNGNRYVKSLSLKAVRILKKTLIISGKACFVAWLMVGALKIGQNAFPNTVYASRNVEIVKDETIPVLDRIMRCESDYSQKDKTGQVVIHVNRDGTYDQGKMQINSVWNATATRLGYDLSRESDNIAFGRWLFVNHGSGPWYPSRSCWDR